MASFLKTFGKGILYFISLPFLLVSLVIYGIYLLVIFIFYAFKFIISFFMGKTIKLKDEMDDKAYLILRQRKKEALARQLNPTPTTINNSFTSINISPEVMKQAELAASKQIIQESEIKTLDLTNEGKEND